MRGEPVFLVNSMVARVDPSPDRLVRWLLIGIALAWQTLRHNVGLAPPREYV